MIDPALGWSMLSVTGINEHGQIVGNGLLQGARRGFILDLRQVPGDIDGNTLVDLADAIAGLQIVAGCQFSPGTVSWLPDVADINGDKRIGSEEIVFLLKELAQ
jgi:hypothetical protein